MIIATLNGSDDIALTIRPSMYDTEHTPDDVYYLSSLRVLYSAGSTSATVTLGVDHRHGSQFDFELLQIEDSGGGGSNINMGIATDEMKEWYFVADNSPEDFNDGLSIAQTLASDDEWSIEALFTKDA